MKMQSTDRRDKTADLDAQRAILTKSIDDISGEIEIALKDASLHFPVYISVRTDGTSLATVATPLDPSDADWDHAITLVCQVLGRWVGCDRLIGRPLVCAVANAARISASELAHEEMPSGSSQ
jgi:hypothetical protein